MLPAASVAPSSASSRAASLSVTSFVADGTHLRDHVVGGQIAFGERDMGQVAAQGQSAGRGLVDLAGQTDDAFGQL